MAEYKIGSKGEEVIRIQEQLNKKGLYLGPLDGIFGGGTGAAVKQFQKMKGLGVDGVVGPETWKALFAEDMSEPSILFRPLDYKTVALSGSFETGKGIPDC